MAEIVKGLFGIDPQGYQDQQLANQRAEAIQYAKLDPFQKATVGMYQGVQQGIGAGLNMMGVQDPELQAQQVASQLAANYDMTSAEGMAEFSRALGQKAQETGLPALSSFANMAGQKALSMKATTSDIGYKDTQTAVSQNKLDLDRQYRAEMQAAVDRGASDEEKLDITLKYGGPDAQAAVTGRMLTAREKAMADTGVGSGPGSVGKTGAYRDIDGNILDATTMRPIRKEFETTQRLLQTLNDVTAADVKNAESFIDWTTKKESKSLASTKTLDAQSKLAASQLLSQIEALPPGSASDKDMQAAMKDFPGYSDAEALRKWVNRTKQKLQRNLEAQSEQFGWKPRITSSGDVSFKKQSTQQPTTQPAKGTRTIKLSNGIEVTVED